jgi:hypothetical protein
VIDIELGGRSRRRPQGPRPLADFWIVHHDDTARIDDGETDWHLEYHLTVVALEPGVVDFSKGMCLKRHLVGADKPIVVAFHRAFKDVQGRK